MKRTHAAPIGDASRFIDDVEAFGPRGVSIIGGVVDVVDAEGDGVVEAFDEIVGDRYTLREGFRLGVADVVLYVGFHLPLVGRVGFAYIHGQKIGVIFVVVVNLHHVTDVAAERWSSVAAEDDDERASASAFANVKVICAVEVEEAGVGSVVPDFERAAMHVGQSIAEHPVSVLRTTGHLGEHEERGQQKHQENANRPFPEETHR
jgi:hypothetical protein